MKHILLLCSLSCFLLFNASAQSFGDLNAKQFNMLVDQSLRIGNKYIQENASDIRNDETLLLDSISIDELDVESNEYENIAFVSFKFEEVEGSLRYDSIFVIGDFSDSPIPILGISGKVNYDEQGRYTGYRIVARTALFNLDFLEYIIEYDDQGRIVLNKSIPNELLGEEIYGDSIVYTIDDDGFVTDWVKYDLGDRFGSGSFTESYQNITYGEDGIMNSYIEVVELEFDTFRTRYTEIIFYEPSFEQAYALMSSDFSIVSEFFPIDDLNPTNELKRLQLNNNVEVWQNNEWVLSTTRTFEYRGDTLVTFTEEQPNIFIEIEEYAFDAAGVLHSRTIIIDPIVVPLTPELRTLYEYDANGNITLSSSQFFAEGIWEESYREEYQYEYDGEENIIEARLVSCEGDDIIYGERYRIWNTESTVSVFQPNNVAFNVAMYPNPVVSESTLVINGLAGESVNILLTDMTGKVIVNQNLQVIGDEMNKTLQFTDVSAGNYVLVVAHTSGRVAIPMIKM